MPTHNAKEIHQYDSVTREYAKSFPSCSCSDHELGLYRGGSADILAGRNNKRGVLLSFIKADTYPGAQAVTVVPAKTASNILTEDELRKKHDMFFMILTFVKALSVGKFIDEPSMLRQLSLYGKPRYREALQRPELKDYKGKVDGVVYYGAIASIKKLKSEGVLQ